MLNQLKPKTTGADSSTESPKPSIASRRGRAARGRGGRGGRGRFLTGRGTAARRAVGTQQTQRRPSPVPFHADPELVERYKRAVDRAVQLAAQHNLDPIAGATYVFVDVSDNARTQKPAQSARIAGFSKQVRTFYVHPNIMKDVHLLDRFAFVQQQQQQLLLMLFVKLSSVNNVCC